MLPKDTLTAPSLEEARQLYQVALRVKELAPWEWMEESDIFGVQNPETGELGFVSLMGMAEEHFAVAVYQGAEGLYGFWDLEHGGDLAAAAERLLEIPQLQASFEDREMLDKQDREFIKNLGLKFRGAKAWPLFRSYRPGFAPWFVTAAEGRFLTHALAQILEVAPRVRSDPDILYDEQDEAGESYLVRMPYQQGESLSWEDRRMRVPPPEPVHIPVVLDLATVGQLKQLPQRDLKLEIDLLSIPTPIGERSERPYLPYVLLVADSQSGKILGFELLKVEDSLAGMQAQIPMKLARWLAQAQVVPKEIKTRSGLMTELLSPLTKALSIKLKQSDSLPSMDALMDSMLGWLMGGES